jgi:hypothetical protein
MGQHLRQSLEVSHLELLHRASTYGDLQAWEAFQQSLEDNVLVWFHEHPYCEAACRVYSERHFSSLAFERLRRAIVKKQIKCEMLSVMLAYLLASLNRSILESLRATSYPGAFSSLRHEWEGRLEGNAIWERLEELLPDQRELRMAYLLYHCGLEPAEIVRSYPQEWGDVHEIVKMRRSILARLMRGYEL